MGFVIEEQAYLGLVSSGEWDALVQTLEETSPIGHGQISDGIAILTDDRDKRFRAGLDTVLAGTVSTSGKFGR